MRLLFPVAAWPTALKVVSAIGTIGLLAAGFAAYRAIPTPSGFTHQFGLGVALIPVAVLLGALFFIVNGYAIEDDDLCVDRLFTSTRLPLAGLSRAWLEPAVCKGSMRIFGNAGLFSFTGLFYSKRLGRYRLFATDFSHAVVLVFPGRVVVITPEKPHAFIEYLRHRFPNLATTPLASDGASPSSGDALPDAE